MDGGDRAGGSRGCGLGLHLARRTRQAHDELTAVVQLQRTEVGRLLRVGIVDDSALDIASYLGAGDQRSLRVAGETSSERLDEAAGEQRMPGDWSAVHGALIIERRRDDATASARAELPERAAESDALAAPLHLRVECDPAVACVEEDEQMPHRDVGDVAQPVVEAQPRARAAIRPLSVDRNDVARLDARTAGIVSRDRVAMPGEEQHEAIVGTEHSQLIREPAQRGAGGGLVEQRLAEWLEAELDEQLQGTACIAYGVTELFPRAIAVHADHGDAVATIDRIVHGFVGRRDDVAEPEPGLHQPLRDEACVSTPVGRRTVRVHDEQPFARDGRRYPGDFAGHIGGRGAGVRETPERRR